MAEKPRSFTATVVTAGIVFLVSVVAVVGDLALTHWAMRLMRYPSWVLFAVGVISILVGIAAVAACSLVLYQSIVEACRTFKKEGA